MFCCPSNSRLAPLHCYWRAAVANVLRALGGGVSKCRGYSWRRGFLFTNSPVPGKLECLERGVQERACIGWILHRRGRIYVTYWTCHKADSPPPPLSNPPAIHLSFGLILTWQLRITLRCWRVCLGLTSMGTVSSRMLGYSQGSKSREYTHFGNIINAICI